LSKNTYSHKDIKVMSEIDHIRHAPGMYIGETNIPNHLVSEVLDNALDEASAGFAKLIGIVIDSKNDTCSIMDNGRGIPIENNTIKTISTKLFSGGKFDKGEKGKAYKICNGIHGIGLVAVTALSEWTTFTIYRDGKKAFYKFERAVLKEETIEEFKGSVPYSTKISFKADKKIFESIKFDTAKIKARLDLASVHIPHLQLIYIIDGEKEIINCDFNKYFTDTLLGGKATKECTPIFDLNKSIKDENIHIKFCWDLGSTNTHKETGCINVLPVDQGTHINMTLLLFKKVFDELCKKRKLKFNSNDCLLNFRCHTSMLLYKPEYSSQTKERLSTTKIKIQSLFDLAEIELKNVLDKNPEVTDRILAFFDAYRKKIEAGKNIIKSKTVNRMNSLVDSKLRDCTSTLVNKTELFITEGASAAGSLIQCRNPKYHGILGLKGKIPNVAGTKHIKDILKNKEIVEIVNALGTGVEPDFTLDTLRYGKIIISTDADSDGSHISTLLMVLFLRIAPQLVKNGNLYIAQLPLYGAMVKKKFIPLYTENETAAFKSNNPNIKIQRYKGLGEMNPEQLKVCLLDKDRRLIQVTHPENEQEVFNLMTDASLKRKLINNEESYEE